MAFMFAACGEDAIEPLTGSVGLKVLDGSLAVNRTGDNYSISGTPVLENKTYISAGFVGEIAYAPDVYQPVYTCSLEAAGAYALRFTTVNFLNTHNN